MRITTTAIVSLLFLAGCADGGFDAPGDPIHGPPPVRPAGDGEAAPAVSYAVPVPAGAGLEEYAVFPLDDVRLRARRGRVELAYTLPAELTGLPRVKVAVEGDVERDGEELHLGGHDGYAVCEPGATGYTCSVEYDELSLDVARAEAYVLATHPEGEVPRRLEVAGLFADDPLGLVIGVRLEQRR